MCVHTLHAYNKLIIIISHILNAIYHNKCNIFHFAQCGGNPVRCTIITVPRADIQPRCSKITVPSQYLSKELQYFMHTVQHYLQVYTPHRHTSQLTAANKSSPQVAGPGYTSTRCVACHGLDGSRPGPPHPQQHMVQLRDSTPDHQATPSRWTWTRA